MSGQADQRPLPRPVEGLVVGLLAGIAVAVAIWWVSISWLAGHAVTADFWPWAAASLTFLSHWLDLPPMPPSAPWLDQPPALIDALSWRVLVSSMFGVVAGTLAGVAAGRAPPVEIHVNGRRITESSREFSRVLRRRERCDGLPLHPSVPISCERERRHMLLCGGTGSGKTQALLPLIRGARERGDRVLIYDHKGDLTSQMFDDNAVLLAPWDARSTGWNIAADVPDLPAARELAAALVPLPGGAGDPMWSEGARQILTGLIAAQQLGRDSWSLADLADAASASAVEIATILQAYHPEAASLLAEPESRTALSYLSNLKAHLAGLFDLARAWPHAGDFSIRDWLAGQGAPTVIVQHAESQGDSARMLLRMIMRLILQRVGDPAFSRAARPSWLFLDEFLQAGKIESLLPIAETARSKDVRLVLACQDVSRLRDVYGRDQADALAGLVGTVLLGRSRGESAQWGSRLAGEKTVRRYSQSVTAGGNSESVQSSYQRATEPVFRPEDFDAKLGTFGRGRRTRNRLLILAGGDLLGALDWPLTVLPHIADAHVPVRESASRCQPAGEPQNAQPPVVITKQEARQSKAKCDPLDETSTSPADESPRERLRRRRVAGPKPDVLGPPSGDL